MSIVGSSRLVQVPGMPTLNIADFPEAYGPTSAPPGL